MFQIIFLLVLSTEVLAERLTLSAPADPKSNLLFNQLNYYKGTVQTPQESISTANAANYALMLLAPSITQLPGYTGIFTGNCSMFFNDILEEVACDINPSRPYDLSAGTQIIPGTNLPKHYSNQIRHSHILLANIFADWTGRKKAEFETDLYFKTDMCTASTSQESTHTQSASHAATTSSSASSITTSVAATMTWLASISTSRLSKTPTSISTPSPTHTLSPSHTHASSITPSHLATHTASLTSSYSKTFSASVSSSVSTTISNISKTLSETLTSALSITPTRTPSLSLPQKPTDSLSLFDSTIESSTATNSLTQSQSSSWTLIPINPSEWARWNRTTGVYANSASQASRYTSIFGVVTDSYTGLQWQAAGSVGNFMWRANAPAGSAQAYCADQNTGGFSNWRLPTRAELQTLVDYTIFNPAIDTAIFSGMPSVYYWTSTPYDLTSTHSINFNTGAPDISGINNAYYARCVRSPEVTIAPVRYSDETGAILTGASTQVKDTVTGLIWQRSVSGTYHWSAVAAAGSAQAYCNALTLGGQSWRLPTIKELSTLGDVTISSGATINLEAFRNTPAGGFWSSTGRVSHPTQAWVLDFNSGTSYGLTTTEVRYSRCVR